MGNLKGNTVTLITTVGFISGTARQAGSTSNFLAGFADFITDEYIRETQQKYPFAGDDGYIILDNVRVNHANETYTIDSMLVFFDNIIGVSLEKKLLP